VPYFIFSSYDPLRDKRTDRRTDKRTDGRARRVMRPVERPHNNICAFVDPTPTCGVATSGPVIRGHNVTLTCIMTYYYKPPDGRSSPGAGISASISWETEAVTFLSNSSKHETVTIGKVVKVVGETLQVSVTTLASGSVIPSYNCTSVFQFTDRTSELFTYALNSLKWTCVSPPVLTRCMYYKLTCKLLIGAKMRNRDRV